MRRRTRFVALVGTVGVLLFVPLRVSSETGVEPATAACADGTCCHEENSDCIINNMLTESAYARLEGGSCAQGDLKPHG